MQANRINYCNSSGFLVKNNRFKSELLKKLLFKYKFNPLKNYEKNYSDRFLDNIKKPHTLCSFITKGKKCFLYCTKILNENITFIIESKISENNLFPKIISIPFCISDKEYYNDSIFSGDMIYFDNYWTFMIEDCILFKGYNIKENFLKRIEKVNNLIKNHIENKDISPFDIKQKKIFTVNQIENEISNCKIPILGVKFFTNFVINFNFNKNFKSNNNFHLNLLENYNYDKIEEEKNILKDEFEENDVIFIKKTNNLDYDFNKIFSLKMEKSENYCIYNLYALDKFNNYKFIGISRINRIEISLHFLSIFKKKKECLVETRYNPIFKKWEIVSESNKKISSFENTSLHIENCNNYFEKERWML